MQESEIIEMLYQHDERGLEAVSAEYGELLRGIAAGVLYDDMDAEEAVSDTYIKVWSLIPPYRPRYLRSFLCRLVRGLAIDKYRYNHRQKRHSDCVMFSELEDVPEQEPVAEDADDVPVSGLTEYIDQFLAGQGVEARVLFMRRYFMGESVQSLAERFGMTENSVSVKLFRTREALRKFLLKKGVSV